jgi:hypothetical protein
MYFSQFNFPRTEHQCLMNRLPYHLFLRMWVSMLVFVSIMEAQSKDEPSPADKLQAEHDAQSRSILRIVNEMFAKQAEPLVKTYLQGNDLESSKQTADFVAQLKDADDSNDTTIKAVNPGITDRLGSLLERYRASRSKELAKLNNEFAAKAQALQKQAMQAGKLEEATKANEMVKAWKEQGNLVGEVASLETILIGNIWTLPLAGNRKIVFKANGTFESEARSNGKWKLSENNVLMKWDSGSPQTWKIVNGILLQDGTAPCGKSALK